MSIIYGTLERLEQAEVQPLINLEASSTRKPPAVSLKSIAVALAGAGMGVGLVLWLEVSGGIETPLPRPAEEETALVAEPVAVQEVVQPQPALVEITVEKTRLAPRLFEPKVPAAAPAEEPAPVETSAPASVTVPAAVAVVASVPVEDRIGPVIDRARVALSRGHYGLALSTLAELTEAPEERSEYWFIKGSAHLGLGQLEPAEFALSAARSLAPQSAQVVVQLSILHQEKEQHALAVEMLRDAASLHPGVPEIYLNLGYSQLALGADSEARVSFRIFLELTKDSAFYTAQRVAIAQWLNS